ncbi:type II CRISPR-associated endonuclease Cas1 [uncultured Senegalimassilia sp.]|uniref:type II CRISPR-associated endonuclease Cas1 n=1 Tax=uncultured Senegalimassilia sp. TaxID=1714350 RepID=UPI0025862F13|nr:type II CRISPR-associated endonuclease Cas1 [uncultured Senegalimassilia sp.]
MAFRDVVIASPCKLSYKGGYLVVRKEDDTAKVHLSEISSVVLQTNQVYISAYLLSELAKAKVSFVVADEKRNPIGQYLPLYGAHNTSKRIGEQLEWTEPAKKRVWQRVVRDKIAHQSRILNARASEEEGELLATLVPEVRSGDTTNREAYAARVYFRALFGQGFSRDDDTPVNAALNYGYGILLSAVNREIVARGYLTQCGICHRSEFNQFNLSCDLMEPFRPIVDRLVFDNIDGDFTRDDKYLLIDMMNQCIPYRGGSYRVGSVVGLYVRDCLSALNRRLSIDEIEAFDVL